MHEGSSGDNKSVRKVRGRADNEVRAIHKEVTYAPICQSPSIHTQPSAKSLAYIWHRKRERQVFSLTHEYNLSSCDFDGARVHCFFRMALADTRQKIITSQEHGHFRCLPRVFETAANKNRPNVCANKSVRRVLRQTKNAIKSS